jgi:hypothetical protein
MLLITVSKFLLFLTIILVHNWFCYHFLFQLSFFRKGLKHLEAVEPQVRAVAEQQHIDYHFANLDDDEDDDENSSGIYNDDDGEDDEDDDGFSMDGDSDRHSGDGQLSFEYRSKELPTSANSMEVIFLF